jgi:hypothetical protein
MVSNVAHRRLGVFLAYCCAVWLVRSLSDSLVDRLRLLSDLLIDRLWLLAKLLVDRARSLSNLLVDAPRLFGH